MSLLKKLNQMREPTSCGKEIIPLSRFQREITRSDIENEIRTTSITLRDKVIDFIWQHARRVFAILVLCSRKGLIVNFIQDDQMQPHDLDAMLPVVSIAFLQQKLGTRAAADAFFQQQWAFSAPDFSQLLFPRLLHADTILPFVREEELASGCFGTVTKVEIHRDYGKGNDATEQFVRKEINLNDESYDAEVNTLARLQSLKHPNMMKITACYTYKGKHNIIAPYVGGGTLEKLFDSDFLSNMARHEVLYLFSGLASAVWALHEIEGEGKGIHCDIRPNNVLFDNSRLILADFGLSRIKEPFGSTKTSYKPVPGYYQAPESADLQPPYEEYHFDRASDIWSLGCIMTDVLMLLARGPKALRSFHTSRRYTMGNMTYYLYHDGNSLVKAVVDLLSQNKANHASNSSLHKLASLVNEMLAINPRHRLTARLIAEHLCHITATAFSEAIIKALAQIRQTPTAEIEAARLESWLIGFDVLLESGRYAHEMAISFDNVVSLLRRLLKTLNHISAGRVARDSREFYEIRHINNELFELLPEDGKQHAVDELKTKTLHDLRPHNVAEAHAALTAVPYGRLISATLQTKNRYANLESRGSTTEERLWMEVPGRRKLRFTSITEVGGYEIAKVEGRGHPRLVLEEQIASYDGPHYTEHKQRLEALCDLLSHKPDSLRSLPIYGIHHHVKSSHLGLLYDLGEHRGPDTAVSAPRVLQDLIEAQQFGDLSSLEIRLKIASQLANALLDFHELDWYHKDLTSRSIILPSSITTETVSSDKCVQLVGFRHSRSANASWSDGPPMKIERRYHDPRYLSRSGSRFHDFKPEYDYYSVGVLLLEIALQKPAERLPNQLGETNNYRYVKNLRDDVQAQVHSAVGQAYFAALLKCFDGSLDADGTPAGIFSSRSRFKRQVALPLRTLSESFNNFVARSTLDPISRKRPNERFDKTLRGLDASRVKRLRPG